MTLQGHFHAGIVVADLEQAMARFHDLFGLDFASPRTSVLEGWVENGVPVEGQEVTVSYSRQGPPHIELIQGAASGVFSLQRGEGLHHLGWWADDLRRWMDALTGRGMAMELLASRVAGALTAFYTSPADLHGVRLEFLDADLRIGHEEWIARG